MAKTIEEIASRVLRKLGRLPEGQSPTGSQVSQIRDEYDELYQELLDDGIVTWSASDDIPDNVVGPVYTLLLGRLADDFGVPNQWMLNALGQDLEKKMKRKISAAATVPYESIDTQFENF